jgi:hypothetical protein
MARFPSSGSGIVSPIRVEAELGEVLADLCTSYTFDELAIDEIYLKLGIIVGKWLSEQERVEVDPIAKALLRMARNLSEVSHLMSGLELEHFPAALNQGDSQLLLPRRIWRN